MANFEQIWYIFRFYNFWPLYQSFIGKFYAQITPSNLLNILMYFDFKIDKPFSNYQAQKVKFLNLREFHLMHQSELKVRPNKRFWLVENVIGERFLNHSTVLWLRNPPSPMTFPANQNGLFAHTFNFHRCITWNLGRRKNTSVISQFWAGFWFFFHKTSISSDSADCPQFNDRFFVSETF